MKLRFVAILSLLSAVGALAQSNGAQAPASYDCYAPDLVSYLNDADLYKTLTLIPAINAATSLGGFQIAASNVLKLQEKELAVLANCTYKSSLPPDPITAPLTADTPTEIGNYVVGTLDVNDSLPVLRGFFGAPASGFSASDSFGEVATFIQTSHDTLYSYMWNPATVTGLKSSY